GRGRRGGGVARGPPFPGLALAGLGRYRHPDAPAGRDALVIGYGSPSESAWAGALDALCRVLP
ncbi:hypothetical protein ACFV00_13645, partial [Streptomyces californicus]